MNRPGLLCCEPTYKELKRVLAFTGFRTNKGCEPTYKELKPLAKSAEEFKDRCCEPTYKELKPNTFEQK